MINQGAFLELMQIVDAVRKVVGRDSMEIKDEDVTRAKEIDLAETAHEAGTEGPDHDSLLCPTCQGLRQNRAMLREKLHSQGQDFPSGVLEP